MKTMLIFCSHYFPHIGGIEKFTYNLSKYLNKKNVKITIITNNTEYVEDYEVENNIEIYRLDCFNLLKGRFPIPKFNKNYKKIFNMLKNKKFDFCLIQARFYILTLLGCIFAKRNNIKYLVLEHGTGHFTVNNIFFDFLGHIYEHIISLLVRLNCNNFAGVSKNCCIWLKHFNIHTEDVIYNGVDTIYIYSIIENSNYRLDKNGKVIISFASRLVVEKGIVKLIDAFKLLINKFPNSILYIAGYGELEDYIKSQSSLENRIIFLGKLLPEEIYNLFNQSDIFVYPSYYPEGFPTVVLEAAYLKNCVIASDRGGTSELIINEDYGILLKNNSVDEIYSNLKHFIENINLRKIVSENISKRVSNVFSWDIISENFINKYLN